MTNKEKDELMYGVFNSLRDRIVINDVRQNADHAHLQALWRTILEAVHASKTIVTHPSISSLDQLIEIIVDFKIERQANTLIYHVKVGNHGLCTAL